MKSVKKFQLTSALLAILVAAPATADLVTITFTADNVVDDSGLCNDSSCLGGFEWSYFGPVPNRNDWRQSDTVVIDLDPGTYWFVWYVDNVGTGGSGNPAGLLAEISWNGNVNSSSTLWEVSTDPSSGIWTSATSYGSNSDTTIWTNNNGGNPVSDISGDAEWLWTSNNFSVEMDGFAAIRTSITVPEPGTLALFGIGLLGIGAARRRKA